MWQFFAIVENFVCYSLSPTQNIDIEMEKQFKLQKFNCKPKHNAALNLSTNVQNSDHGQIQ